MARYNSSIGFQPPGWWNASRQHEDKRSVLVALTSAGDHVLEMLATIHLQGMLTHEPLLAESLSQLRRLASLDK
jgi:hypothetical protein